MFKASKRESADRLEEIELITKECEDLQDQNTKLTTMLTEKEETNARLVSEQIRAHQAQTLTGKLKELYQEKINHLEAKLNSHSELLKASQRKCVVAEEEAVRTLFSTAVMPN